MLRHTSRDVWAAVHAAHLLNVFDLHAVLVHKGDPLLSQQAATI